MVDFVLPVDLKRRINELGGSKADYHGRLTVSNNRLVIRSLWDFLLPWEKDQVSTGPLVVRLIDSENLDPLRMSLKYDANGYEYVLENWEESSATDSSYSFKNGSVLQLWSFRTEINLVFIIDRIKLVDFVLPVDVKEQIEDMGGSKADYHGRLIISNNRLVTPSLDDFLLPSEKKLLHSKFLAVDLIDSESPTFFCMSLKYDNGYGYVLENYEKNSATYSFKNGSVVHLWSFRDEFNVPCFIIIYA